MRQAGLRVVVVLLLATVLAAPLCAAEPYRIAPGDSIVRFTVTKLLVERVSGDFQDFQGTVAYHAEKPEASSIELNVEVRSVVTGERNRDSTLQGEAYFDSRRYPRMVFRSVRVSRRSDGGLDVTGDLTIRGVTRQVTVPVRVVEHSDGRLEFETAFTVNRTEFGVNGTSWSSSRAVISHEADIYLRIVAKSGEAR